MPTIIKNGLIYDGSGSIPVKRDILIEQKRIMRIGDGFRTPRGTDVVDASGAFVVPGFINVHSHSDHNLSIFSDPYQEHYIEEGITSVVGGNCGKSLFPFSRHTLHTHSDWDTSFSPIGADWVTAKDFFDMLHKKGVGVNFGSLIGLGTVRNFITKGTYRDLTDSELSFAKKIIEESLHAGILGLSSGLEYPDETHIPSFEIKEYLSIVGKHEGIYSTHLRDYGKNIISSLDEAIMLAKSANVRLEISHLDSDSLYADEYIEVARKIENCNKEKFPIRFDTSPFGEKTKLCYMFLPGWAREGSRNDIVERVMTPHTRENILPRIASLPFDSIFIARVPGSISFLTGKSIADFAASLHVDGPRALLRLIEISHATALCVVYTSDEELHKDFLYSDYSLLASHSAGAGFEETVHSMQRKRLKKFFKEAYDDGRIPFEKFIMKLTSYPASYYRLGRRGLIREGYYADITVLRDFSPSDVFVNGVGAMRGTILTKSRSGHMIRRKDRVRV